MPPSAADCAPSSLRRIEERSSGSTESSEDSIYNAVRTISALDESIQKNDTGHEFTFDHATMARLLVSSAHSMSCITLRGAHHPYQPTNPSRWHPYRRPNRTAFSTYSGRRLHTSAPAKPIKPARDAVERRQVLSLNDADNHPGNPQWTTNLASPASPVHPRYPPPTRAPTPPGVPSFGTRAAARYYAQLAQPLPTDDHTSHPATDNTPSTTYGGALRRFLGASAPTSASASPARPTSGPSALTRAPDGTVVLGHFPYRHSGHGITTSRRLDDHPFHRRALPVAQARAPHPSSTRHMHHADADTDDAPASRYRSPAPAMPAKQDLMGPEEPAQSWTDLGGVCTCCLPGLDESLGGSPVSSGGRDASARAGLSDENDGPPGDVSSEWLSGLGRWSREMGLSIRRFVGRALESGEHTVG
ncbi:hypothetical protein BDV59DRAFT_203140 [Aspergillus ambiguus]|uniref:uncharacterized protein n=1 Tax=Aspergillus ambiguus TaxID=176160 RepID=UPI003CCC9CAC